jgi:carboxypeptidase Q
VGWTNEENGLRGGTAYRDQHAAELGNHVLAIESDGGIFAPIGFGFTGSDSARTILRDVVRLLDRIGADSLLPGGGGADIGPIMQRGVPGMSHVTDGDYFWYHHTDADTVDKVDPAHLARSVAMLAVMAYVVADLPARLPR